MTIDRARLVALRSGDATATRAEMRELCTYAIALLDVREATERSRLERAALDKEPVLCSLCGSEIKPGQPNAGGVAHWSCYTRAKNIGSDV